MIALRLYRFYRRGGMPRLAALHRVLDMLTRQRRWANQLKGGRKA